MANPEKLRNELIIVTTFSPNQSELSNEKKKKTYSQKNSGY
jgi:hypothetical protein